MFVWAGNPARQGRRLPVTVDVKRGMSAREIGGLLERQGVIRSSLYWRWMASRTGPLKPGTYQCSGIERPEAILQRMVQGQTISVRVGIPEGFTVAQIAQTLADQKLVARADDFERLARSEGERLAAQLGVGPDLEGFLFPDTYEVPVGASGEEIIKMMTANFERRFREAVRESGAEPTRSVRDTVVIASLVEREARTERDRPMVAGVIENRLAAGQKLEIDATVQYARGAHKERLFFKDLEVDSPYNTYRNRGLPPGPICNPGLRAMVAALRPAQHPFRYYVLGKDGRNHDFSKTFEEHKRRIAEIRGQ